MQAATNAPSPSGKFLRLEVFSPHVCTDFRVKRGSEWVTVRLSECTALGGHRAEAREKFSLLFVGGHEKPLQQGTHEFEHPGLGEFALFITPVISQKPDERWYEAIINRETMP